MQATYDFTPNGSLENVSYTKSEITGLPNYEYKYNAVGAKSVVKRGHKLTASEVLNYDATGQFTDWDQGVLDVDYELETPTNQRLKWTLDARGNWSELKRADAACYALN